MRRAGDAGQEACPQQGEVLIADVRSGVDDPLFDLAAVRRKSIALTDLFIRLVETRCGAHGLKLVGPRDGTMRGSQVSFEHEGAYEIMQALIERGVIGDFRAPATIRFGFTPLYTRFEDAWRGATILADILANREWDQPRFQERRKVT